MKTTLAALVCLTLLTACLPLAGCQQLGQAFGVQPATTQPSDQARLDALKLQYGAAMDVLQPLVDHNVITNTDALKAIRTAVKEVDAAIKDAQAQLDAHLPITARFYLDKVAAAVATLEREKSRAKP